MLFLSCSTFTLERTREEEGREKRERTIVREKKRANKKRNEERGEKESRVRDTRSVRLSVSLVHFRAKSKATTGTTDSKNAFERTNRTDFLSVILLDLKET